MIYPQGSRKLAEKTVKWAPQNMIQASRYKILGNKDNHQNNKKDKNKNEKRVYEVN